MATLQDTFADVKEAAEDSVLVRDLLHDAWDAFGDVIRTSHVLRIAAAVIPVVGAIPHLHGIEKGEPIAVFTAAVAMFGWHCWTRHRKARVAQHDASEGGLV